MGAAIAFALAASALMIGTNAALAQEALTQGALTADEFFGSATTGEDFAGQAGLGQADLTSTIAQIIRIALGFLGILAVIIILMGGFKWMTAGGNDDKVKDAKKLIISGIIGLVIVVSAFAIASFVITQITLATQGSLST